jgi:hypothetical protein
VNEPMIFACRCASPAALMRYILLTGDHSKPYTGSVKGECELCHDEVWIGPRQQEALATCRREQTPHHVVCFLCAAPYVAGGDAEVKSLGNPEKPK